MSRKEDTLKALARAVGPDVFDHAQYIQRSAPVVKIGRDVAAGSLGFAALDWGRVDKDGNVVDQGLGAALEVALLKVKYLYPNDRESFIRAHQLLLDHWAKSDSRGKRSATMIAVAYAALFEWTHDDCPACRGDKRRVRQPYVCTCVNRKEKRRYRHSRVGPWQETTVVVGTPLAGCEKCRGLGRIFGEPVKGRGMRCLECGNSGRVDYSMKARWRFAVAALGDAEADRRPRRVKPKPATLDYELFKKRWHAKYTRFLNILRATDKHLVAPVDIQIRRLHNAAIVRGPEQEQMLLDEPDALAPDERAVAQGTASPSK